MRRGVHLIERCVAQCSFRFCSRILFIKFRFSKVKVCVVVGYGPNEDDEERDRFWNDMDRILDRVGKGYRL